MRLNKQFIFSVLLTLLIHVFGILFLLRGSIASNNTRNIHQEILTIINIVPAKPFTTVEMKEFVDLTSIKLLHTNITPPKISDFDIKMDDEQSPEKTKDNLNGNKYNTSRNSTIFDPRLREKLQNHKETLQSNNQESWINTAGDQMVDLGNGDCFVSMKQINSNERGTTWAPTKCGKSQSEKMIDNINKDLKARKLMPP